MNHFYDHLIIILDMVHVMITIEECPSTELTFSLSCLVRLPRYRASLVSGKKETLKNTTENTILWLPNSIYHKP